MCETAQLKVEACSGYTMIVGIVQFHQSTGGGGGGAYSDNLATAAVSTQHIMRS